ncbi:MAG: hypothetical protein NVSMB65_15700 [Chloroflexota bacterium]
MQEARRLGEIVAVSTSEFTTQSYELDEAPAYGSLVCVGKPGPEPPAIRHFGVCYRVQTSSIEPGRHAVAWGRDEDDDADIFRRQPQLREVLHTTWDCLLVGYRASGGGIAQRIPAAPPRMHSFVYAATSDEVCAFHRDLGYLRFILRSAVPGVEDLLAACIRHAYECAGRDDALLLEAGRTVARLLPGDHARLMSVLELLAS